MNSEIDLLIQNVKKWQEEMQALRSIILECGLNEEVKWGQPCYTIDTKNIVIIGSFKEYCALLFMKGVLLKDPQAVLIQQTENVQAGRQIRFTNVQEILDMEKIVKEYVQEAIEVERSGLKVDKKKSDDLVYVQEFQDILDEIPELKRAFESLTPGRQRAYDLFFSEPKQSKTRTIRVEKMMQRIFDGKGLDDCTCGLTKRAPKCDGSHKNIV